MSISYSVGIVMNSIKAVVQLELSGEFQKPTVIVNCIEFVTVRYTISSTIAC